MTNTEFTKLWEKFIALGEEALTLNHYALADITEIKNPQLWKEFITTPKVSEYIESEMAIIRETSINKMIQQSADSRSVGQSQLINTLQKVKEDTSQKKGPTFIFCHVPLSAEQTHAPNIRVCDEHGIYQDEDGAFVIPKGDDED